MKISKSVYGYIIIFILLGGLIITKMLGVWELNDRDSGEVKHRASAPEMQYVNDWIL